MNPHELTPDERTLLELVAAIAAEQSRRDPLLSRTSVLRAASARGVPKLVGRDAWHTLIESGVLVALDGMDAEGAAFTPHPRPYRVIHPAYVPQTISPPPGPHPRPLASQAPLSGSAGTCAPNVTSRCPPAPGMAAVPPAATPCSSVG